MPSARRRLLRPQRAALGQPRAPRDPKKDPYAQRVGANGSSEAGERPADHLGRTRRGILARRRPARTSSGRCRTSREAAGRSSRPRRDRGRYWVGQRRRAVARRLRLSRPRPIAARRCRSPTADRPSEGQGAPPDFRVRRPPRTCAASALCWYELPIEEALKKGDTEIVLDRMVLGLDEGQPLAHARRARRAPGRDRRRDRRWSTRSPTRAASRRCAQGPASRYELRPQDRDAERERRAGDARRDGPRARSSAAATARVPNQRFALRTAAAHARLGAHRRAASESTLEMRVDGVRWDEAPALYGLGAARPALHRARRATTASASVIFGDGRRRAPGRRPATENIVATYRTGHRHARAWSAPNA